MNAGRKSVNTMREAPDLLKKLIEYGNSDFYPFHMPGHKRQYGNEFASEFPDPFSIDITEIDGFDNLHHPEGILKESMEWASKIYGSYKTYYLVNGSSCGILSAISGTVPNGKTILMSRNCHKSAYHGVFLNRLKAEYIYPQIIPEFGLQGGLLPEKVEEILKNHGEIQAVLVVSPTYDGIVSDIEAIARIVHGFHLPLIVDEAHGAHFPYGKEAGFPVSALELGADVVIQSLHKTLPSFTQTALMHVREGYADLERIDRYVHMYQTSSPSYVLMAGIENCLRYMSGKGSEQMRLFSERLEDIRHRITGMKRLRMLTEDLKGNYGVYDMDPSKILISTREAGISGAELDSRLRKEYHLEMEMCGPDYVTAITSLADTQEGLERLCSALLKIDSELGYQYQKAGKECCIPVLEENPVSRMTIAEAMDGPRHPVPIACGNGRISAEFVYVYPPGIPIVSPGEVLRKDSVDLIMGYRELGLPVQGMEDENVETIYVVDETKTEEDHGADKMGKIFYVMGKSASGKDTIYKRLLERIPQLKKVILYTTRPVRDGEKDGVEYYFTTKERLEEFRRANKLIEERTYETVYGPWSYFTVDDGQIDLAGRNGYLMIGTLESYEKTRAYFGEDRLFPVYVEVEEGERLLRAVEREKTQKIPRYKELCRRFLADEEDFKEENLARCGIYRRFCNQELETCLDEIIEAVRAEL